MTKLILLIVLPLVLARSVGAQDGSLGDHPEVASGIRLLKAWIETQMAYSDLPGLSMGIVYDQDLIWVRGFGYADRDKQIPATPDTIYRIASNSKVFTSIAVLKLRDEGKLRLDDPVKKHLPWFRIKNTYPDAHTITIRHLLTHTSGLPRESPFPYFTDFEFPTREQMIGKLSGQETIYPSETKWKYSNLAFALAGEIISAVAGTPYADYVHKNILEPLGMNSTSVVIPDEHKERLAIGYGRRMPDGSRRIMPFTDCKALAPAGNLSSTVHDLARFLSWQFRLRESGKKEVLKAGTLLEMQRVHWLLPDWKSGWGLGFQIVHREARDLVGHRGWVAGYQSGVYISPKEKVGVIVLTNADDAYPYPGAPFSITDRAFEWVAPAIAKAASASRDAEVAVADPAWDVYAGTYRNFWEDFEVLVMNGKLMLMYPTELDPRASMLTLIPTAEHSFRIEGEGYAELGELLTFELGADGKVMRMKMGENYAYPQE